MITVGKVRSVRVDCSDALATQQHMPRAAVLQRSSVYIDTR